MLEEAVNNLIKFILEFPSSKIIAKITAIQRKDKVFENKL